MLLDDLGKFVDAAGGCADRFGDVLCGAVQHLPGTVGLLGGLVGDLFEMLDLFGDVDVEFLGTGNGLVGGADQLLSDVANLENALNRRVAIP